MDVVIPQNPKLFNGYFPHLETTLAAARHYGNNPIVLEPNETTAVEDLRAHYRHHSPNPEPFEFWCLASWLYLAAWMRKEHKDVAMRIDSDTLLFGNMDRVYAEWGRPTATVPSSSAVLTRQSAEAVEWHIICSYRNGTEQSICAPHHVDDLHLVTPKLVACGARDVGHAFVPDLVVDSNLYNVMGDTAHYQGHKDIWFVNGQPIWRRDTDCGATRMLTLHCWSKAAKRLPQIWAQARQSAAQPEPVRLTIGD